MLKETTKMGDSGCIWGASQMSQGEWQGDICHRNWYFKLSVACINYSSSYLHHYFYRMKLKVKKLSKFANVIQIVSENTVI